MAQLNFYTDQQTIDRLTEMARIRGDLYLRPKDRIRSRSALIEQYCLEGLRRDAAFLNEMEASDPIDTEQEPPDEPENGVEWENEALRQVVENLSDHKKPTKRTP